MAKYIVVGDKNAYIMETATIQDAWEYAEKELKFGMTGNTKVTTIIRK